MQVDRFSGGDRALLSQEKTLITHIQEGFDLLGQYVRKYGDTLLITPSKSGRAEVREVSLLEV